MGRNPKRASGVKALQAIRENGQATRAKKHQGSSENTQPGVKRSSSPTSLPNPKRTALGNVTNNPLPHQPLKPVKATITANASQLQSLAEDGKHHSDAAVRQRLPDLNESVEASQTSTLSGASEDTPVTAVQHFLQATSLSDDSLRSEESLTEDIELPTPPPSSTIPSSVESGQLWKDIDQAEANDPLFSAEYTPEIFRYMREREEYFSVEPYMPRQPDITAAMRTILVDWLVEVQENFELFHETLYIAVKLTDLYLSRREVKREYLQLVGATCMLIASKFEELSPPLVDDFLYLCDDAYTHQELLRMERDILHTLNYDINVPVSYRFVRRLARAAEATMETHTLARYIAESTLQEYQFVDVKPSLIAASAMFLALRMRKLGAWTPTLQHYSCYSVQEMLPVVQRLNALIQAPPSGTTSTVRSKYSHEVFFKVALTPALEDVTEDARQALLECPSLGV